MTVRSLFPLILSVLIVSGLNEVMAQAELARIFSDGMVIQRDHPVPVWGTASPGERVTVRFEGETATAAANVGGEWRVELPSMEAGGPYAMAVDADGQVIEVRDILVGDVWIASGQSNMEWVVADSRDADAEIAAANDPSIRHFKVPQSWSEAPEKTLAGGSWTSATPDQVGDFTAAGFFFARELREHVGVPIGLINTTWGGSRLEPWMSAEALGIDETQLAAMMDQELVYEQEVRERIRLRVGELPTEDPGLVAGDPLWAAPDFNDSEWGLIPVPSPWEAGGFEGMDGIGWYRTDFELTEDEAASGVTLGLGVIDDADISWVNGYEVGAMEGWNQPREYEVPPHALQAGRNVLTVRVEDTGGGGGILGTSDQLFVRTNAETRPLAGDWRFNVGEVTVSLDARRNQLPTLLYNKMIHPLNDFPITGVIWYQGESNAYPDGAYEYRQLFADLIEDWRERWGVGDFPFLYVQLANYMEADDEPAESDWAVLRESQSAVLEVPNTAQAVTIDIGEADDIHPRNKQDVGRRLALAARHLAYDQDVVYSGPTYESHEVRDGRVEISFEHVGGGLTARGGDLRGFAIAGENGRFVWANATIEGDRVIVWSDEVPEPSAVRYAWGNNPETANLYNTEGLPASPFRTDMPR